ncbi:hypothetical protein [Methylomonas sp. HYX-M1]|uniref:hypothetical protein n=1 Tax=Methylomonas sp. HYX-M1 TaxID=3139307 RepID=UPI00345B623B
MKDKFPFFSGAEIESLAKEIEALNTVTACQFCNSTTSRDVSEISMHELFLKSEPNRKSVLENITQACAAILKRKQDAVKWKLESVEEAFYEQVVSKMGDS